MPDLHAQVYPASDPIFNSRLERIVESIPGSPLDLPPFLAKSNDVYLLVTEGAAYTDIQLLANPTVPPQTLAHDLETALETTPLHAYPVEWSADHYSAAQVFVRHGRIGSSQGANTLPLGIVVSGLRKSSLTPHLLLRIPGYAAASALPRSHHGTQNFRWYDTWQIGGRSSITVTARITGISLMRVLVYYLLVPVIGVLGLLLANVLSRRGSRDVIAQRLVFRSTTTFFVTVAVLAQTTGMFYLLQTPTPTAIADLWFGSSTTTLLVPYLVAGISGMPLFLILARRQEIRRFGPAPVADPIPMSDEENAARKRVAQYAALPHLIGAAALIAVPFFVPHRSPLYSYVHPLAQFLPILGGGLIARVFQKRLDKFTQKSTDDDLTWRARQLEQKLNVRMPNVFVEDSSRAAHLAFASHQRHDITLSRKLRATFTAAETDFVLAHHLACMKRSRGRPWIQGLMILPLLFPLFLVIMPHLMPGPPLLSTFFTVNFFCFRPGFPLHSLGILAFRSFRCS